MAASPTTRLVITCPDRPGIVSATEELDAGPIIEQGVTRVDHRDDAAALTCSGAEIERTVLARAVQVRCQDRILRHGNTTVVF